ncbi:MAG TPA: hypothetical protein DCK78_13950 [Paenibacillus lactis]|nr:hypothetical protein [Paenibacillus lactis]
MLKYPLCFPHIILITIDSSIRKALHLSTNQPDNNLINTVERLDETPVNSLDAQHQQARNDRRKQALHVSDGKYNENKSKNYHQGVPPLLPSSCFFVFNYPVPKNNHLRSGRAPVAFHIVKSATYLVLHIYRACSGGTSSA